MKIILYFKKSIILFISNKRLLKIILSSSISLIFLYLLFYLMEINIVKVIMIIHNINFQFIIISFTILLFSIYIAALRLKLIFKPFKLIASANHFFMYTVIGMFFNNFIPSSLGGDLIKAVYASNKTGKLTESMLATISDRIIGLLGILIIGSIGIYFNLSPDFVINNLNILLVLLLFSIGIIILWIMLRYTNYIDFFKLKFNLSIFKFVKIEKVLSALMILVKSPFVLLAGLVVSLIIIILTAISIWLISKSIGLDINYTYFLFIIPIITFIPILPSINGIGIREAAFVFALKGICPNEKAITISIIFYFFIVSVSMLGGITLLFRKQLKLSFKPIIR